MQAREIAIAVEMASLAVTGPDKVDDCGETRESNSKRQIRSQVGVSREDRRLGS